LTRHESLKNERSGHNEGITMQIDTVGITWGGVVISAAKRRAMAAAVCGAVNSNGSYA